MPEHGKRVTRPQKTQHGVGRMDPPPAPRVAVEKSVGRNQNRAYCPACGAKRQKDGSCPRGHPN